MRHGVRLRSVVFGAAVNWYEDGSKVWTGGLDVPLFPFPFFPGPPTVAAPEVASETMEHPDAAAEAAVLRGR